MIKLGKLTNYTTIFILKEFLWQVLWQIISNLSNTNFKRNAVNCSFFTFIAVII